jgi:hypothetical protein
MRFARGFPVLALAAASAFALASDTAAPNPGWEKLKALVGTWECTEGEHPGNVTVTYELVSNGSTLMETMEMPAHSGTMVTMYAPDSPNGRIIATHYCAAGNQPRMAAKALKGDTLDFQFLDATNVTNPNGDLMRSLEVKFQDADHFQQVWTSRANGKDQPGTFHLCAAEIDRADSRTVVPRMPCSGSGLRSFGATTRDGERREVKRAPKPKA